MSILVAFGSGKEVTKSLRPFRISPLQSDILDLARWVAAFLVVVEHLRSLMFADYGTQGGLGGLGKLFYFFTGFGHCAVMIFFVMSGFLVGAKVLDRLARGKVSWRKYAIDRSSRIYVVYLLALLLGGALDYAGWHWFNAFGLYNQKFSGQIGVVQHNFHQNLSLRIFAVNLAMCQTILGPVFGSNGPLWSLSNECWYYVAGPLLFAVISWKNAGLRRFGISVIGLAAFVWFLPAPILIYSLIWLMGAGLYFINDRALIPLWISLPMFAAACVAARFHTLNIPYVVDFLVGISFALVINSVVNLERRLPWNGASRAAADFSYSVYLCHFPFLALVLSALYQATGIGLRSPSTPVLAGLAFAILGLTYLWCYLVSLASERQTVRIREALYRLAVPPGATQKAARPLLRAPQ